MGKLMLRALDGVEKALKALEKGRLDGAEEAVEAFDVKWLRPDDCLTEEARKRWFSADDGTLSYVIRLPRNEDGQVDLRSARNALNYDFGHLLKPGQRFSIRPWPRWHEEFGYIASPTIRELYHDNASMPIHGLDEEEDDEIVLEALDAKACDALYMACVKAIGAEKLMMLGLDDAPQLIERALGQAHDLGRVAPSLNGSMRARLKRLDAYASDPEAKEWVAKNNDLSLFGMDMAAEAYEGAIRSLFGLHDGEGLDGCAIRSVVDDETLLEEIRERSALKAEWEADSIEEGPEEPYDEENAWTEPE